MPRAILHVDMDEFFAAVEKLDHPELRGKCLLIGGDPRGRGVVSTASYEARVFGCRSAMPMSTAVRLCPHAIVLPPRGQRYAEVSEQIFAIFSRFTPLVEPLSIDEAFLDVAGTERLFGPALEVAEKIKRAIRQEVGLTASVGVAPNMFLAKVASDLRKPDGLTVITEETIHRILDPLPIRKLWGTGAATEKQFLRLNVHTVGQLRTLPLETVAMVLGSNAAEHFLKLANGLDDRGVTPDSQAKSIGQEQTFPVNVGELDELRRVLLEQVDQVARRLRRHGFKARTVTLKLRYGDFTTLTRSHTMPEATNITRELWEAAQTLLMTWSRKDHRALRLLGVTASGFIGSHSGQMSLFERAGSKKMEQLDKTLDAIAEKFGDSAVLRAASKTKEKGNGDKGGEKTSK